MCIGNSISFPPTSVIQDDSSIAVVFRCRYTARDLDRAPRRTVNRTPHRRSGGSRRSRPLSAECLVRTRSTWSRCLRSLLVDCVLKFKVLSTGPWAPISGPAGRAPWSALSSFKLAARCSPDSDSPPRGALTAQGRCLAPAWALGPATRDLRNCPGGTQAQALAGGHPGPAPGRQAACQWTSSFSGCRPRPGTSVPSSHVCLDKNKPAEPTF